MSGKKNAKSRAKGTGSIKKIKNRFYFRTQINGIVKCSILRNQDDTPCTNKEEAEAAAKLLTPILRAEQKEEIAIHVANAKRIIRQSGMMLKQAWETYLKQPNRPESAESTLKNHFGILNLFLNWIKNQYPEIVRVAEVDADIAEEYFSYVWATGVSAKRYNDNIISLRLIFRHLMKPAAMDHNPFDAINKKTLEVVNRKEFTKQQVMEIFDGFNNGFFYETEMETMGPGRSRRKIKSVLRFSPMHADQMRVLLNLCCWAGCDGQSGCLMRWENIDFTANRITYVRHKTRKRTQGKIISLPLHPDLRTALIDATRWQSDNINGEDYILPAVAARYKHNPSGVQKDVMKIIRCATGLEINTTNVPGRRINAANLYSLHSFRHSFVSFCANAGVPLAVVSDIVGDSNPTLKRFYCHISDNAKEQALAALPEISRLCAGSRVDELRSEIIKKLDGMDADEMAKALDAINRI